MQKKYWKIKRNSFDREIKLKTEIKTFEDRVMECENEIDKMVNELYSFHSSYCGMHTKVNKVKVSKGCVKRTVKTLSKYLKIKKSGFFL
jgi:predicted phage-related endonuclease